MILLQYYSLIKRRRRCIWFPSYSTCSTTLRGSPHHTFLRLPTPSLFLPPFDGNTEGGGFTPVGIIIPSCSSLALFRLLLSSISCDGEDRRMMRWTAAGGLHEWTAGWTTNGYDGRRRDKLHVMSLKRAMRTRIIMAKAPLLRFRISSKTIGLQRRHNKPRESETAALFAILFLLHLQQASPMGYGDERTAIIVNTQQHILCPREVEDQSYN